MKKWITAALAILLALGMIGCAEQTSQIPQTTQGQPEETAPGSSVYTWDFSVPGAMEYPIYSFEGTPTTDQLRQMAVRAMRDQLTVRWGVDRFYSYGKLRAVSSKHFSHIPENVYAGMPYTGASATLIHWFEYYDTETGILSLPGSAQNMNNLVGNSCAASVTAGWVAVCPSFVRVVPTFYMIPEYGAYPVGDYVFPMNVKTLKDYTTDRIIADNTLEVMLASYAKILPADGLVSTLDNHAVMAIEPAHVVYRQDGSIDEQASYVAIQDQRGGSGDSFYIAQEDGIECYYSGRTYHAYTFKELYDLCYIPVTPKEFTGELPYEAPKVSFSMEDYTAENIHQGTIYTNYQIVTVRGVLVDSQGERQVVERRILSYSETSRGMAEEFAVSYLTSRPNSDAVKALMREGETYTFLYEVTVANGETLTAASVTVSK